jgi:hypothetical protein
MPCPECLPCHPRQRPGKGNGERTCEAGRPSTAGAEQERSTYAVVLQHHERLSLSLVGVLTHAVLGTLSAYAAEVIVPEDGQEEEKREEVVNEFE